MNVIYTILFGDLQHSKLLKNFIRSFVLYNDDPVNTKLFIFYDNIDRESLEFLTSLNPSYVLDSNSKPKLFNECEDNSYIYCFPIKNISNRIDGKMLKLFIPFILTSKRLSYEFLYSHNSCINYETYISFLKQKSVADNTTFLNKKMLYTELDCVFTNNISNIFNLNLPTEDHIFSIKNKNNESLLKYFFMFETSITTLSCFKKILLYITLLSKKESFLVTQEKINSIDFLNSQIERLKKFSLCVCEAENPPGVKQVKEEIVKYEEKDELLDSIRKIHLKIHGKIPYQLRKKFTIPPFPPFPEPIPSPGWKWYHKQQTFPESKTVKTKNISSSIQEKKTNNFISKNSQDRYYAELFKRDCDYADFDSLDSHSEHGRQNYFNVFNAEINKNTFGKYTHMNFTLLKRDNIDLEEKVKKLMSYDEKKLQFLNYNEYYQLKNHKKKILLWSASKRPNERLSIIKENTISTDLFKKYKKLEQEKLNYISLFYKLPDSKLEWFDEVLNGYGWCPLWLAHKRPWEWSLSTQENPIIKRWDGIMKVNIALEINSHFVIESSNIFNRYIEEKEKDNNNTKFNTILRIEKEYDSDDNKNVYEGVIPFDFFHDRRNIHNAVMSGTSPSAKDEIVLDISTKDLFLKYNSRGPDGKLLNLSSNYLHEYEYEYYNNYVELSFKEAEYYAKNALYLDNVIKVKDYSISGQLLYDNKEETEKILRERTENYKRNRRIIREQREKEIREWESRAEFEARVLKKKQLEYINYFNSPAEKKRRKDNRALQRLEQNEASNLANSGRALRNEGRTLRNEERTLKNIKKREAAQSSGILELDIMALRRRLDRDKLYYYREDLSSGSEMSELESLSSLEPETGSEGSDPVNLDNLTVTIDWSDEEEPPKPEPLPDSEESEEENLDIEHQYERKLTINNLRKFGLQSESLEKQVAMCLEGYKKNGVIHRNRQFIDEDEYNYEDEQVEQNDIWEKSIYNFKLFKKELVENVLYGKDTNILHFIDPLEIYDGKCEVKKRKKYYGNTNNTEYTDSDSDESSELWDDRGNKFGKFQNAKEQTELFKIFCDTNIDKISTNTDILSNLFSTEPTEVNQNVHLVHFSGENKITRIENFTKNMFDKLTYVLPEEDDVYIKNITSLNHNKLDNYKYSIELINYKFNKQNFYYENIEKLARNMKDIIKFTNKNILFVNGKKYTLFKIKECTNQNIIRCYCEQDKTELFILNFRHNRLPISIDNINKASELVDINNIPFFSKENDVTDLKCSQCGTILVKKDNNYGIIQDKVDQRGFCNVCGQKIDFSFNKYCPNKNDNDDITLKNLSRSCDFLLHKSFENYQESYINKYMTSTKSVSSEEELNEYMFRSNFYLEIYDSVTTKTISKITEEKDKLKKIVKDEDKHYVNDLVHLIRFLKDPEERFSLKDYDVVWSEWVNFTSPNQMKTNVLDCMSYKNPIENRLKFNREIMSNFALFLSEKYWENKSELEWKKEENFKTHTIKTELPDHYNETIPEYFLFLAIQVLGISHPTLNLKRYYEKRFETMCKHHHSVKKVVNKYNEDVYEVKMPNQYDVKVRIIDKLEDEPDYKEILHRNKKGYLTSPYYKENTRNMFMWYINLSRKAASTKIEYPHTVTHIREMEGKTFNITKEIIESGIFLEEEAKLSKNTHETTIYTGLKPETNYHRIKKVSTQLRDIDNWSWWYVDNDAPLWYYEYINDILGSDIINKYWFKNDEDFCDILKITQSLVDGVEETIMPLFKKVFDFSIHKQLHSRYNILENFHEKRYNNIERTEYPQDTIQDIIACARILRLFSDSNYKAEIKSFIYNEPTLGIFSENTSNIKIFKM
tara:strand:- start:385 stop:5874 length:5490 start_codon:yes stop_codon:yes gene_type:complete